MKHPRFTVLALGSAILLAGCGGNDEQDRNAQSTFGNNSVNAPAADTPQVVNPEERPEDPARPLVAETPELRGDPPPRQISQQDIVGQVHSPRDIDSADVAPPPELRDLLPDDYTREDSGIKTLAMARMMSTDGHTATGLVAFIESEADEGVRVITRIDGIPSGSHGFHVHENGDCSAPDASSAGDHFNPTGAMHGGRDAEDRHVGDLGNLLATEDARAAADFTDTRLSLSGANSIVGKAFVVHAQSDDLVSQPAGNSGDRIACGVIEQQDVAAVLEAGDEE